jgi:hypothetical protein
MAPEKAPSSRIAFIEGHLIKRAGFKVFLLCLMVLIVSVMKPPNSWWKTDVDISTGVLKHSRDSGGQPAVEWQWLEGVCLVVVDRIV